MRRPLAAVCLALTLGCGTPVGTTPDWADWPYVRAVATDGAETRLVSIEIPTELHARADPRLSDLRVIDDEGREVPFLIHVPGGVQRRDWRPARLLEASVRPGAYTQVVVDTGSALDTHDTIELAIGETDVFAWVEVAASDDRQEWRVLNDRLPLYRFTGDGGTEQQVLRHAPSASRFLRLRLSNAETPITITGVRIARDATTPPVRREAPAIRTPAGDLPARHSGWQLDLGGPLPVSQAIFTSSEPEFHRPVRIESSDDGRRWRLAGDGVVYRLQRATGTVERLEVTFPETASQYLRVGVFNRDDPPLPDLAVTLRGVPRAVVFRHDAGRSYRLIYGVPGVQAPAYELGRLVTEEQVRSAVPAAFGAEMTMPGHPRPLPWTERHVGLLWLAVVLAVTVLGWLAVRSMREADRPG